MCFKNMMYLPKIDTVRVPIPAIFLGVIQVGYAEVAFPYEIVFCDLITTFNQVSRSIACLMTNHYTRDRTHKHGIGIQIIDKYAAAFHEVPWQYTNPHDSCNVTAASNILEIIQHWHTINRFKPTHDIKGHQRSQVTARTNRICRYV